MSRPLLLILLLGFVLRVTWALLQPADSAAIDRLPDQREYLSLAQNLLHDRTLSFVDPRYHQRVYAYRLPGYPLLLAACGGSIRLARVGQSIVDVSTLIAVFLIGRKLSGGTGVGLIAAALMAVNPFYIFFSGLILSETVFAALVCWSIWFISSNRFWPAMVLLIGAAYVRPTGLLLSPLLLLWYDPNVKSPPAYHLLAVLCRCLVATLTGLVCLFPWAMRNHHLVGSWVWTTTNSGITLYDGFHSGATGGSDQQFIADFPLLRSINEVQRSDFFRLRARDWIPENWREIPGLSVKKILRGWSPVPLSAEFGRPIYRLISAGYSVPFDLLCLIGLFSRQIDFKGKLLLVMPALLVTFAQVMSVGSIRYRMPAEAPLAVLAAAGAMQVFGEKSLRE